jgi:hypothetical protein
MADGGLDTYALSRARVGKLAANPVKMLDDRRRMALEEVIHQVDTAMAGE